MRMRMWMWVALVSSSLATPAAAAVIAYVVAPASVDVGAQFDVELRANLDAPVIGWGLDLAFDPAVVQQVSPPTIGPDWFAVSASDGDGLAGIAAGGLTGDRRLAVVRFQAIALGSTSFVLSDTLADLSEGFALDPTGFASVSYQSATVNVVVPEPATALLLAFGVAGLAANAQGGRRKVGRRAQAPKARAASRRRAKAGPREDGRSRAKAGSPSASE